MKTIKSFFTKMFNVLMISAILVSQFTFPVWNTTTYAMETMPTTANSTVATKYFYSQITEDKDAKVFYEAMETMMSKGYFKDGTVSMEVTGLTTEDQSSLMKSMGAARDAFMLDYPELFYVDFDYLSLRGEIDKEEKLHIYLGTGRGENYINQEFLTNGKPDTAKINAAINTVNARIESIVKQANGKSIEEQVRIAHDEVIKAAKYTLEYKTDYPYTVRTIYGVFGLGSERNAGNAVCEGYARALKAILDRLEIPAILVRGVYNNVEENKQEEHMWVYVQIDGKWYGVDPTFDNSYNKEDTTGEISNKYLLVSADGMNYHYPLGILSTSNFEFTYPDLNGGSSENKYIRQENDNVVYSDATGLVVIDAGSEVIGNGKPERVFHISYNGKGYAKAAKEDGIYIITNSWQEKTNNETGNKDIIPSEWNYPSDVGAYKNIYQDYDTYLAMRVDNVTALQVGLTNVPQGPKTEANYYGVYYKGGENGIVAMSTDIYTGVGLIDYAQPFPKKTTPSQTLAYTVGKKYHFTIEYDQKLKYTDEENPKIDISLKLYDNIYGYRDPNLEYLQFDISDPVLEDDYTISFDLTPSRLWTMDKVQYMIQFTGVVGTVSNKEPFPIVYGFSNNTTGCIYALRAMGIDMESYGKPTLIDDFDLDDILSDEFKKENGISDAVLQQYGDLLKHRLSLVVTNTTEYQEKKMEDALLKELEGREFASGDTKTSVEMYNISLSLCTEQLKKLKTGTKLKVMLGFPLGYGPEDKGVTFKAYHYNLKDDGTYAIEEIDCIVTELGLVIYVDSFSPFAVAALKATDEEETTDKTINLNVTDGGKVSITNSVTKEKVYSNVISINDNNPRIFTVEANEGYKIDKIEQLTDVERDKDGKIIGYELKEIKLSDENTFVLKYEKIDRLTTINVSFVAEDTGTIGDPEEDSGDSGNNGKEPQDNYEFLEGTVFEFDPEKDSELTFRVSIPYETFKASGSVYVDGKLVAEKYYTVDEGSTIITFADEYTKTLEPGDHTIELKLNDVTAVTTTFKVKKTNSDSDTGDDGSGDSGSTGNNITNNPNTASMNINAYATLVFISLLGLVYVIRKKIA